MSVPAWKVVWRKGIAPQLTVGALVALKKALLTDDVRLLQGATTSPPPFNTVKKFPVDAACALGYCGWQGEGLSTAEQVDDYFHQLCWEAEKLSGYPTRWFLNFFDDTPRAEMRRELLIEVQAALDSRKLATVRWRLNGATPQEDGPMGLAEAEAHAKRLNSNAAMCARAEVVELPGVAAL